MMNISKLTRQVSGAYRKACFDVCESAAKSPLAVGVFAVSAFVVGSANDAFAAGGNTPLQACNQLLSYIEGGFASLVAAAAGLGAIVAAAVGGFKAAWALIVVSIGAYILRSYIGLFLAGC